MFNASNLLGSLLNGHLFFYSYNVAALIANEIVSDIKTICTQQTDAEDLGPLREHLLSGRGWRGLALLHAIGLQVSLEQTNLFQNFIQLILFLDMPHINE